MLEKIWRKKRRNEFYRQRIFVCALVQIISLGGDHWVAYVYIFCVAS